MSGIMSLSDAIVYLDDSPESQQALELLQRSGKKFVPEYGGDTGLSRRPILYHGIGTHEGLDSIKAWLDSELIE